MRGDFTGPRLLPEGLGDRAQSGSKSPVWSSALFPAAELGRGRWAGKAPRAASLKFRRCLGQMPWERVSELRGPALGRHQAQTATGSGNSICKASMRASVFDRRLLRGSAVPK
jgi:hypothetical protein